jgi:RNA polymerase sigma-70 factor
VERTREEIFGVLVGEHELGLTAFVRACVHDAGDAADIVQDVFIAAWQRLDEYERGKPFAAWLRGIAQHKVADYFRQGARQKPHLRVLPPEAVVAIADEFSRLNRPARGEAYRDCFAALRECLEGLGREDRVIVQQAYREARTCQAIAEQLGRTVEAVKKRLQRARAALRDCILSKLGPEEVSDA